MKINRSILSCDENELYIQFWPIVARAWDLLGIKPTLFLISSNHNLNIDQTVGDVFFIEPVEDIPTSFQAQCIRHLGPTMFPEDISIISDIDMMPLNYQYFVSQVKNIENDKFISFSSDAYLNKPDFPCLPMCYNAALGKTFNEIFKSNIENYKSTIKKWYSLGHGWTTDERVLFSSLRSWDKLNSNVVLLKRGWSPFAYQRIDRAYMQFNPELMLQKQYIDFHMPRPYNKNKDLIDYIFTLFKKSLDVKFSEK